MRRGTALERIFGKGGAREGKQNRGAKREQAPSLKERTPSLEDQVPNLEEQAPLSRAGPMSYWRGVHSRMGAVRKGREQSMPGSSMHTRMGAVHKGEGHCLPGSGVQYQIGAVQKGEGQSLPGSLGRTSRRLGRR